MSALGQKQTCAVQNVHVPFTPESRHVQRTSRCPLSANSGHGHPLITLFFISCLFRDLRKRSEGVCRGLFASAGVLMQINAAQRICKSALGH